jgi:hypothetical protein
MHGPFDRLVGRRWFDGSGGGRVPAENGVGRTM